MNEKLLGLIGINLSVTGIGIYLLVITNNIIPILVGIYFIILCIFGFIYFSKVMNGVEE